MAWWSWFIVWGVMLAVLLGTVGGLGLVLFRKAMRTMDALDELAAQLAAVGSVTGQTDATQPAFRPAVFHDQAALKFAVELRASERRHRRQVRRDELITQGKLLSHAQMIQRTKPHAR
ncbi:hypothetical protein JF66_00105 [Cryobacterium sp. MLB-32]|uniref:hypothetical protein n=1 Tax=Cryobacterium sp. MLB-32 TaxID=1529318 RepID=UPI0004E7466B|nr:hypothetical protein [Cryobacterium sp. MLB-32]KFF61038.1 hypothetical protein JF66_00105 [Cryobacterium sp. MLB-32]